MTSERVKLMAEKVFTLRMNEELFDEVKNLADKNKRSIAKEIEFQLEQCLSNDTSLSDIKSQLEKFSFAFEEHDYELRRLHEHLEKIVSHFN